MVRVVRVGALFCGGTNLDVVFLGVCCRWFTLELICCVLLGFVCLILSYVVFGFVLCLFVLIVGLVVCRLTLWFGFWFVEGRCGCFCACLLCGV